MSQHTETTKKVFTLTEIVAELNEAWRKGGNSGELKLESDQIEVTESEVKMRFHTEIVMTISKNSVDLGSLEAVSQSSSTK